MARAFDYENIFAEKYSSSMCYIYLYFNTSTHIDNAFFWDNEIF